MAISAWQNPRTPDLGPELGSTLEQFLGHLALFGILGILVSYDIHYIKGRQKVLLSIMAASLVGLIWGAATEWYQLYVPGREGSLADVLTNMLGAVGGGLVVVGLYRLLGPLAYRS